MRESTAKETGGRRTVLCRGEGEGMGCDRRKKFEIDKLKEIGDWNAIGTVT